jgi:hypothetical protein
MHKTGIRAVNEQIRGGGCEELALIFNFDHG